MSPDAPPRSTCGCRRRGDRLVVSVAGPNPSRPSFELPPQERPRRGLTRRPPPQEQAHRRTSPATAARAGNPRRRLTSRFDGGTRAGDKSAPFRARSALGRRNARRWPAATAQRSRRIPSPASIGSTLLPPSRRRLLPLFLLARFTASRRPRSRATWSDSILRPRRRRPQVRRPERPRLSSAAAAGPPVAGEDPGRCVPRPGSARGRGGPGSRPRPPPSRRWPGLSHGRGARRGRRRGSHPRRILEPAVGEPGVDL